MAIDITVSLTDAEQALVQELALKVAPGSTSPQIIAWVTKECKTGLRTAVVELWNKQAQIEAAALNETQRTRATIDFPEVT